jgi:hypothetical protein
LILAIFADIEVSLAAGMTFHPVAGDANPQIFRSRIVSNVISKLFESGEPVVGKSNFHCAGFITLYLIFDKVLLLACSTAAKVEGG